MGELKANTKNEGKLHYPVTSNVSTENVGLETAFMFFNENSSKTIKVCLSLTKDKEKTRRKFQEQAFANFTTLSGTVMS